MKTLFPHPNGQPGDTSGKTSGHTGKISRLFTGRGTRFTTNRGARATLLVLIFIIVISGALLIRYHTFIVPFRQCSETYQHYAGQPGIEATFIKDFRINDSLSVCATLLEVQDSDTWYRLMHEFNIPIQELNSYLPTDRITIKISPRGHPEISGVTDLNAPIDVITIDRLNLRIGMFHAANKNEEFVILDNRLITNIKIKNPLPNRKEITDE